MFILGGDYTLFPRGRLLQKISSLANSFPSQSLPQILDPSLREKPLFFLIPLKDSCLILFMNCFPQNIELTSCQFNLLMNLNHLLKPSIILAGEMLCRKKSMPKKEKKNKT